MKYRALGQTGFAVSEIGLGCEHLEGKPYETVQETIHAALDAGINILDVFMSEPQVRSNIGRALNGHRDKVYIQGHLRAVWEHGQYGRTTDLQKTQLFFEDLLRRLGTDYIDLGMLHLVDNETDYHAVMEGGILEYAQELKKRGVLRAVGLSCHNPEMAIKAVESGTIELLLFSLNPAYDLMDEHAALPLDGRKDYLEGDGIHGINAVRERLYTLCAAKGVGITVMKALGAGTLLRAETSPFGRALSAAQCIRYALDRPAVSSVLVGMQSRQQVLEATTYDDADINRDYATILREKPKFSLSGHCMYCNHCLPCPQKIDIAQVNKYLDLAEIGTDVPPTVREHYASLAHKASDCIQCGSCETRCPFGVPIRERMLRAAAKLE